MDLSKKFVITINRELGSGGRSVGEKLAAKLGVPFYDKLHIKAMEEKFGLSVEEIERLKGEKRTWWQELRRMVELDGKFAVSIHEHLPESAFPGKPDSEKIFQAEQEILREIAEEESCVIAGRCGFYALKDHPNHLSILIQAPMQKRIERLARKDDRSLEEAGRIIEKVDKQRENYVSRHAGTSRYDARNYDLVISMNGKTVEEVADLIVKYIG